MNRSAKRSNGFTLIELSIYMGLMMIVILIVTEIFTAIMESQLRSANTSNLSIDGRYIYTRFIYDVNRADSIATPSALGSSSAMLGLKIDGNDQIYQLENNNLVITNSTGQYKLNGFGTTVSDLQFTKIGNINGKPTVRINFTINGNVQIRGNTESKEFQTTAGLR